MNLPTRSLLLVLACSSMVFTGCGSKPTGLQEQNPRLDAEEAAYVEEFGAFMEDKEEEIA